MSNRKINKGKMIFSKENGFHTREEGFWHRGMSLEGNFLGKCVKPRVRAKMKGKAVFYEAMMG